MNFFLNGVNHPFLIPAHLILMVSLALLLAQQGRQPIKWAIPLFVASLGFGLVLTRFAFPLPDVTWLLMLAMGIALITAIRFELWQSFTLSLAALSAFLIGIDSAPLILPGFSEQKIHLTLAGTGAGASLFFIACIVVGALLQQLWQGIVVRSVASWVIAASLMTLALQFVTLPN